MKRLVFLLLFFPLFFSCNSKKNKKISKKTEFKNGRWISTTDSLAGIEIRNNKWIMFYKDEESESTDIFDFEVLKEYRKDIDAELEYLTITNDQSGTLEYAILEYSDQLLSLSYIGRGNTLNYKPEKVDLKVDITIEKTFSDYVEYWSDGDFDKIVNEIYNVPFVLYTQDSTTVMNTNKEVKDFLISTFNTLESNNYGYSIRNKWEHFKSDKNISIIEMNFTRYLKDSTVMGKNERSSSYILRKYNGNHRIVGMIPHTPISE